MPIRTGQSRIVSGVQNVHVALVTQDTVAAGTTYDTPVRMDGVSDSISITDNVNTAIYYGDNRAAATAIAKGTIDLTISKEDMSQEQEADILGKTINADGFVEDAVSDNPPYMATMYELTYEDGGSKFVQIDKVRYQEPGTNGTSKTDNVEFQPMSLVGMGIARNSDGRRKRTRIVSASEVDAARTAFFANANDNAGAIPALTATSVPLDAATGVAVSANLVVTFSNTMQEASANSSNIMLITATGTAATSVTYAWDATGKILTIGHANLTAATAHLLIITDNVRDMYGQGIDIVVNFTTA